MARDIIFNREVILAREASPDGKIVFPSPTLLATVRKRAPAKWVMSLAENLHFRKSASIAFDRANAKDG